MRWGQTSSDRKSASGSESVGTAGIAGIVIPAAGAISLTCQIALQIPGIAYDGGYAE